jgi:hypothetical protein
VGEGEREGLLARGRLKNFRELKKIYSVFYFGISEFDLLTAFDIKL